MYGSPEVTPRTGITAADSTIAGLPIYGCQGASVVRLGALSNTLNATISIRVIFFDSQGTFVGGSIAFQFTATYADYSGNSIGVPTYDAWFPTGGAYSYCVKVDSVSAGTWTLTQIAY